MGWWMVLENRPPGTWTYEDALSHTVHHFARISSRCERTSLPIRRHGGPRAGADSNSHCDCRRLFHSAASNRQGLNLVRSIGEISNLIALSEESPEGLVIV